jgi:hypothetical protein
MPGQAPGSSTGAKELNPPGEIRIERFGWTFGPGDKVMQVENDYDRDVYITTTWVVVLGIDTEEGDLVADFGPLRSRLKGRRHGSAVEAARLADRRWCTQARPF